MTWWALWDKVLPVAAVIAAGALGFRLGRAYERIDWLTGRRGDRGADHG